MWISVIDANFSPQSGLFGDGEAGSAPSGSVCILCKGSRLLCGKPRCPLLVKFYSKQKTQPLIDSLNIDGSSPPGVFIGRYGYPHVSIGPLIPPLHGDTTVMDTPELWQGRTIDDIVDFRLQLVRGKYRVNVNKVGSPSKIVGLTRELALCRDSAEIEASFSKKPVGRIALDDEVQPFGPSAPLEKLDAGNFKFDNRLEKAHYDTDMLSRDAVLSLYDNGVMVSRIQRAFSVGAFGVAKRRKFVPTRWSITAVDSMLSSNLMDEFKEYPTIDEYRIYETVQLDNRWQVIMAPRSWCYELVEAWYPNTAWNPLGKQVYIISDHENFDGRTTYARIGGCYYAARLAVGELLTKERRQAGVAILREAHPGYIMPVGVWNVRENVRACLKTEPHKFDTLGKALEHVSKNMDIPLKRWINHSAVLHDMIYQRRIDEWIQK